MRTDFARMRKLVEQDAKVFLAGARGVGRTTYACHQVAGMVLRARPHMHIVWLVPEFGWCRHIFEMLHDAFLEHGIEGATFAIRTGRVRVDYQGSDVTIVLLPVRPGCQHRLRGRDFDLVDDLGEAAEVIRREKSGCRILSEIRHMERRCAHGRQRMRAINKYRARFTPEW